MEILERDAQLQHLAVLLDRATRDDGVCALIHGEAGIGKTTLVRQFVSTVDAKVKILIAGCEALFTPRPLGPLVDMADQLPLAMASALHDGPTYNGLFPSFLAFLREKTSDATLLVIEDVHWADAGTLDFIRYVGRRLTGVPVLMLLTYRDESLSHDHPIRRVLGELPAASTSRLKLAALSASAVEQLARNEHRSAKGIFEVTGGNPFFVTEVLMADGDMPASVIDAVLARVSHLSALAHKVTELVSITPNRIERSSLDALLGTTDADIGPLIDECVSHGVLQKAGVWLSFRHEIARQAVMQSLPEDYRAQLHRRMFEHLRARSNETANLSRLVHHAEHAGLIDDVLVFAPRAAEASAKVSAHREAAALYALALKHSVRLGLSERADLLEATAQEYRLVSETDKSLACTREALAVRRLLGNRLQEGMNLRLIAATEWRERGERAKCEPAIHRAIKLLERLPPSTELARTYSTWSWLQSHWAEYDAAVVTGEKALALAETMDDPQSLIEALHMTASAKMCLGDDRDARSQMERALEIAILQSLDDTAGHLFIGVMTAAMNHRDHAHAQGVANRGVAYCQARDLDVHLLRLLDRRATSLAEMGRWDEADHDLDACLASPEISIRLRSTAIFLRERLNLRRGIGNAQSYWLDVQAAPDNLRVEYRLPAIASACAEAAWLREDNQTVERISRLGLDEALSRGDARLAAPLLVWLKRIDAQLPVCAMTLAAPQAHELSGDLDAAAEAWHKLSCPYERALVLVNGDETQLRESLLIFDSLGAKPAADIARRRLRTIGARNVGRGPQTRTATDPMGLTARQREVYALLMQGLSNAVIAEKLHRSERTVENHVANLFTKLNVNSRVELMARSANTASSQPIK
jgi:DNA-binding CsgD family transcriptional regulator/tetratricopeptide (TPR) repeat protein